MSDVPGINFFKTSKKEDENGKRLIIKIFEGRSNSRIRSKKKVATFKRATVSTLYR